jgi:hypothetical protein
MLKGLALIGFVFFGYYFVTAGNFNPVYFILAAVCGVIFVGPMPK